MKILKQIMISKKELKETCSMTLFTKSWTLELASSPLPLMLQVDSEWSSRSTFTRSLKSTLSYINHQNQKNQFQIQKLLSSFSKCQKSWFKNEKQSMFTDSNLELTKDTKSSKVNFERQYTESSLISTERQSQKTVWTQTKELTLFQNSTPTLLAR